MAEHKNSAQAHNAQLAAFDYFEQIVKAQPGCSVEMRTSEVTPRSPYLCTMITFTAAERPMSQIALPVAKKGIEIQIKRFREQDGEYVRDKQVLFKVELPACQQSARNDWAAVYHVVTPQIMAYTGSSRDVLTRIEKEHLLGKGGCRQLKGLRGGHWMVLFDLGDLPLQTRNVLAPELSIGLLDLILQVAEQLAILAGLAFSPETRLNQLTCTFGHFRYDERANVYSILLCRKRVRMQYASSIHICNIACLRCICAMPIYMIFTRYLSTQRRRGGQPRQASGFCHHTRLDCPDCGALGGGKAR
jgi:hypothetical protein